MLEGLDAIDWASLEHAYGPATDLPGLLRAVLSSKPQQGKKAIEKLGGCLCHQGTLYSATAAAIPFLYELLASPGCNRRDRIAFEIASIVVEGTSGKDEHAEEEQGVPVGDASRGEAAQIEEGCLAAVGASLPLLVVHLSDQNRAVRWYITAALRHYPDQAAQWLPALEAALSQETDESIREEMNQRISEATQRGQRTGDRRSPSLSRPPRPPLVPSPSSRPPFGHPPFNPSPVGHSPVSHR